VPICPVGSADRAVMLAGGAAGPSAVAPVITVGACELFLCIAKF
jgi:hypothetical protein